MPENNEGLGWKAALEPDLQQHADLADVKEVKTLARSYVDLKGREKSALYVPGADANDEVKAAFKTKLNEINGVPQSADKYDLPFDPKAPEYDADLEKTARNLFHKAGLNNEQANTLLQGFVEIGGTQSPKQTEKIKTAALEEFAKGEKTRMDQIVATAAADLKTEWGGEYEKNVAVTMKAVDNIEKVVPGFKKYADESGLGNNPFLIKAFAFIGKAISEDVFVSGSRAPAEDTKEGLTYKEM